MAYIGNTPALKYASFAVQHFTTSATTGYTLDNAVTNENGIALFVNNVRQQPGASYAYTVSGTSLTLSAATTTSDTMYCVFIGKAVQTVIPPVGSVATAQLADLAVTNAKVADDAIGVDELSATGTASSSTFLRGDNAWQDPGGVALTGSTNNTVVTVTGADAIAGEANLQFDGTDLTVSTGNVVMGTSGKGIDFSADGSGAGMTSELLDDYEEGTWTPVFTNTGGTPSYTWQHGKYVKVGRHVWLVCNVKCTVTPSGVVNVFLGGFPFANVNTAANYWPGLVQPYQGFDYGGDSMMGSINDAADFVYLKYTDASTTYNRSSFLASALGTTLEMEFSINYPT